MSHLLWKYYLEDDVDKFRRLLAAVNYNPQYPSKVHNGGTGHSNSYSGVVGSPGVFGTSPKAFLKTRKGSSQAATLSGTKGQSSTLSRPEVNSRDHAGLTVLHRAASSTSKNAITFAMALIEHPSIDLCIQDTESGWTALHRALYFGNITIARAIMERDRRDPNGPGGNAPSRIVSSVIKIKDHEGNSPFDVYNATIARRSLQRSNEIEESDNGSQDDAESMSAGHVVERNADKLLVNGDEIFCWGSSKNYSLGLGDQDDRQYPEKITLKRPDHLLFRFYQEHIESIQSSGEPQQNHASKATPKSLADLPALILNMPIIIQDVTLSKLHSAILTTDPESNLYMCGFGPGGRLGTGDEITRFSYVCIEEGALAGKKVVNVALGQNHSLAVSSEGEIMSWGMNGYGQLGYALPRPAVNDEEPICTTPRQIFGPLKREIIIGVAASAIHSVAHTASSLFTWGKNEGQLGLMDSDSRSLDVQPVPRKVAVSLFKAPILMISAINAATICLLANHMVCVFTSYGYNIVKFPLHEGFSNYHLRSNPLTTRYDTASNHISSITAGGDMIVAISSRGDLFTVNVRKVDTNPVSISTTNPSKIKGALSQPELVWSLRKGNWDGIKSVAVAENGSVIVCTQAGAVWRRVKRAKIKDAYIGAGDFNRKDFKFQRVPGLTKVTAVRSSTFGVYAAIRKDCDVTKTQILVKGQNLWHDIGSLLCISGLEASEPSKEAEMDTPRFWTPVLPQDLLDPLKRAVLRSPDLEADVKRHLLPTSQDEEYDTEIGTTLSDTWIPVHGFILARSPVLRNAISESRLSGESSVSDVVDVVIGGKMHGRTRLVFQGLDFITVVNLAIYLYTDTVVDVWNFARHSPQLGFRYRQVRVELMKAAAHLKMGKLESAARLMTEPDLHMNIDMAIAIQDPAFFEDGDTVIELDGSEVMAHSSLLCQRCPFFKGLFNGRAGGQWLAGRRQIGSKSIMVDLKHIEPEVFHLVLRYLYADVGTELFDDVVSADIDEFSELVMDVMGVANELMLDRLSQICQEVIGRFVNTRNASQLLNVIAPCSVTEFKDAALEYICLQLECMLENHLIDDLDEDLVLELDEVIRANQLNRLPFAKSGRAELLLHERHPNLAGDIHAERQRRIRDMTFRANVKEEESRLSSSFRARIGSLDDLMSSPASQEKAQRKYKAGRNAPFSPSIRPKDSTVDLMFDMEDDVPLAPRLKSPVLKPAVGSKLASGTDSWTPKAMWDDIETEAVLDDQHSSLPRTLAGSGTRNDCQTPLSGPVTATWSSPAFPPSKLDMKEIMAQASSVRTSNLSMNLSARKVKDEVVNKASAPKLSQKERKKQQQAFQQVLVQPSSIQNESDGKPSSPWQVTMPGPRTSLKDVLIDPGPSPSSLATTALGSPFPSRSLTPRRTASRDTRFAGQQRIVGSVNAKLEHSSTAGPSRSTSQPVPVISPPLVPHSKSYTAPASKSEPPLQLSMADIIGQQRREQEIIKEAVVKRSLQEIQEEQAFQEWWDQESRRAQEEAALAAKSVASGPGRGGKSGGSRGKGGSRGRGLRGRGDVARSGGRGRG